VFTYVEIVLVTGVFGKQKGKKTVLKFLGYIFFTFCAVVLAACVGLLSGIGYYVQIIDLFEIASLSDLQTKGALVTRLVQALIIVLIAIEAIMLIVTGFLLCYIIYVIMRKSESLRRQKSIQGIFVRAVALGIGLLFAIPNITILCVILYMFGYVHGGVDPNPWPTEYTINIAYQWLTWGQFVTELFWLACICYAMSTVVKRNLLHQLLAALMGLTIADTTESLSSGSRGSVRSQKDTDDPISVL